MRFKTLGLFATTLGLASPALSSEIEPQTGKVVFAPDDVGLRFETGELEMAPIAIQLYDTQYQPLDTPEMLEHLIVSEPEALEGSGYFELGGTVLYARLDLRESAARFSGRRVEIKYWQQTLGTRFSGMLSWLVGNVDAYLDNDDPSDVDALAYLSFQPTGRVSDDGWEEWTTGPFDFEIAGKVAPQMISMYDEAALGMESGIVAYDDKIRSRLDAFEIADLGPALVPEVACTFAQREQLCGEQGTCYLGQCADAAPLLGPLVQNPDLRKDYLDRHATIFTKFEGGRAPLAMEPAFRARLRALEEETSARDFREGLSSAIYDLADGHASPPYTAYAQPLSAGVCAYLGDADLLPDRAERPIVFDFDAENPIGSQLQVGDVLTAIDGLPPRDFAALARARLGYGGDPAGRETIEAASLFDVALEVGATLTISRCAINTSTVSSPVPCTSDQVETIELDLAALTGPILEGRTAGWTREGRTCDFRFRRPVEGPRARDYEFAGHTIEDGIMILQINGVPAYEWDGGRAWFRAVNEAFADSPQHVILDQRMGGGGSPDAVDLIAGYLVYPDELFASVLFPRVAQGTTEEIYRRFISCIENIVIVGSCGNFSMWPLGFQHPNGGASGSGRLAIVSGLDVSGNDFLPKQLTYRSRGATRFFGPAPTYGAFGAVVSQPSLMGDLSGGSFQIQDTVFARAYKDYNLDFTTSTGIPPDERVVQKQSDAVRGIDTVLEAAKMWVLQ